MRDRPNQHIPAHYPLTDDRSAVADRLRALRDRVISWIVISPLIVTDYIRALPGEVIERKTRLYPALILGTLLILVFRHYLTQPGYPAGWDVLSILLPVEAFSSNDRALSVYEDTSFGQTIPLSLAHIVALINSLIEAGALLTKLLFISVGILAVVGMYRLAFQWTGSATASTAAAAP